MGWLLTKSKGKRKRKKRPARREPMSWGRVYRMLQPFGPVFFLAALAIGWVFAHGYLKHHAVTRSPHVVKAEQVELADAQPWMNDHLQHQLKHIVAAPITDNPLDSRALDTSAASLAANPWVERVERVERTPDGVAVYATYRKPVALIGWDRTFRPVDANGILLPGQYSVEQLQSVGLPVIVGLEHAPGEPGQPWQGDDLRAGLALVDLLEPQPFATQIMAYDVSQRDDRNRLRLALHTAKQGVVLWGLPPGLEMTVERDAATKVNRLNNLNRVYGSIDAGGKVVEVFGEAVYKHKSPDSLSLRRVGYTWQR